MTITDATPTGEKLHSFTLETLTERSTVREILRARIWQEVQDYNQQPHENFRGLIQPTNAERVLNGAKLQTPRVIDWEAQFHRACEAFETNGWRSRTTKSSRSVATGVELNRQKEFA